MLVSQCVRTRLIFLYLCLCVSVCWFRMRTYTSCRFRFSRFLLSYLVVENKLPLKTIENKQPYNDDETPDLSHTHSTHVRTHPPFHVRPSTLSSRPVLSLMLSKITREKARERGRAAKNERLMNFVCVCVGSLACCGRRGLPHHGLRSLRTASSLFKHITATSFLVRQRTRIALLLRRWCFPEPNERTPREQS